MDLRLILAAKLERRQDNNPRYSLRAFARSLGIHHSMLAQILQRRRRLTTRAIRQLGERVRLSRSEIAEASRAEDCTAVLRLVDDSRFRPESRWIAIMTGIPTDDVNVALHLLLLNRQLTMHSKTVWRSGTVP